MKKSLLLLLLFAVTNGIDLVHASSTTENQSVESTNKTNSMLWGDTEVIVGKIGNYYIVKDLPSSTNYVRWSAEKEDADNFTIAPTGQYECIVQAKVAGKYTTLLATIMEGEKVIGYNYLRIHSVNK